MPSIPQGPSKNCVLVLNSSLNPHMEPCHDILSISLLRGPSYSDSYSPAWGGIVIISSLDPCRAQPSDPAPRPQDVVSADIS